MAQPNIVNTEQDGLVGLAAWLPRRLLLAIDIMLDIAFNGASGPLPAAELGQHQGLETRKLEAILQRLSRAHLLKSVRGPNGGYLLGDERIAITLGAIARAVLGGDTPRRFSKAFPLNRCKRSSCRRSQSCIMPS